MTRHPDATTDINPLEMIRWEDTFDFLKYEPELYSPDDGESVSP